MYFCPIVQINGSPRWMKIFGAFAEAPYLPVIAIVLTTTPMLFCHDRERTTTVSLREDHRITLGKVPNEAVPCGPPSTIRTFQSAICSMFFSTSCYGENSSIDRPLRIAMDNYCREWIGIHLYRTARCLVRNPWQSFDIAS